MRKDCVEFIFFHPRHILSFLILNLKKHGFHWKINMLIIDCILSTKLSFFYRIADTAMTYPVANAYCQSHFSGWTSYLVNLETQAERDVVGPWLSDHSKSRSVSFLTKKKQISLLIKLIWIECIKWVIFPDGLVT